MGWLLAAVLTTSGFVLQAVKMWRTRLVPASEPECSSIFGGSYHVPLLDIETP